MEPQSGIKTWQWVVTVIVIVLLIIIGIKVFSGKGGAEAPVTTDETPITTDDQIGAINRIIMSDQFPGNIVYISTVQVSSPSWVVIQADNAGTPGKVIGSARFAAGINPGKITLTQSMVDGNTYYAVIYTDSGAKAFDATKDLPLKDAKGNVIMRVFKATSSADAGLKG
ncbi:MAG: hypothetical protein WCS89_00935 [Candidatus Paceibacterota bacterium]